MERFREVLARDTAREAVAGLPSRAGRSGAWREGGVSVSVIRDGRRRVAAILVVGLLWGMVDAVPAASAGGPDMKKFATCIQDLNKLYQEEDNSSGMAAMTAFQKFGGMVNSEGRFNEKNAKAKLARCGVPAVQFDMGIALIQDRCEMKPSIKKGSGARYWEKLMTCLVNQRDPWFNQPA
ncbi:hypothetical protein [Nonomuraea sp. NPDC050783]|uniref:hypothetical protein n=1 Tax=Nonomuraea sp. NPDC050783 TaxID=3154634 RepID=UPI0034655394